ncbi:hypothetical protein [Metabacillus schmidteae]|uniref:hypothetical protein n=1 Tax=Metabacillus schmidteae TaxID=2730405 RepID=UPI00158B2175|nr:hypothetical protein [Metabacillus schmidteae]
MRKPTLFILMVLFFTVMTSNYTQAVGQQDVKVLNIETNTVIREADSSNVFDREVREAIKSIKRVTVQASPLPKKGYLIKIPLTATIKVKNRWFDDYISEVIFVYNLEDKNQHRLILYNDDNTPSFFDLEYNFDQLSRELNFKLNE